MVYNELEIFNLIHCVKNPEHPDERFVFINWDKAMATVEYQFKLLNMNYYFEKFKLQFDDVEMPNLQHLSTILQKCLSLYSLIFKIIEIY